MKTIYAPDLNIADCDAAEYHHLPLDCKKEHLSWMLTAVLQKVKQKVGLFNHG